MPEAQTKKVSENSKYNDGRKFCKFTVFASKIYSH